MFKINHLDNDLTLFRFYCILLCIESKKLTNRKLKMIGTNKNRWINPHADTCVSFEPTDDFVDGSHMLGYIRTSYDQLVELFGEPNGGECDKTHNSWDIEFAIYDKKGNVEDTVYCNLYDWKEVDHTISQRGEYDWHIGGVDPRADFMIYDLLGKTRNPEYRFFFKGQ